MSRSLLVAALVAPLALAALPAAAETGREAAVRALGSCLSRISGGQFPDPIGNAAHVPDAADAEGRQLMSSGDPVARVKSDDGDVYIVEPKGQCVADSFGLDSEKLYAEGQARLKAAPYNATFISAETARPELHVESWSVADRLGRLTVIFFRDTSNPARMRTIMLVERDTPAAK